MITIDEARRLLSQPKSPDNFEYTLRVNAIVNLPDGRETYENFDAPNMQAVQHFINHRHREWTSLVITVTKK